MNAVTRGAALGLALEVGRIVVQHFHGGRPEIFRQRGRRCPSLRKLAGRPELPMSASALYRCVAIYELSSRLGDVSAWEHLGVSHLRAVLGLPMPDQQRLLAEAQRQRWTVRALEAHVAELRETAAERRGRPPIPGALRSLRRLLREADRIDTRAISELDSTTRESLRQELADLRERCDRLEGALAWRPASCD